jgi:hypothetical protein
MIYFEMNSPMKKKLLMELAFHAHYEIYVNIDVGKQKKDKNAATITSWTNTFLSSNRYM